MTAGPPGGFPPTPGGYPPTPGGYPPAPGGYPPTPGGYPAGGGYGTPPGPRGPVKSGVSPAIYVAIGCGGFLVVGAIIGAVLIFMARGDGESSESSADRRPARPAKTAKRAAAQPKQVWITSTKPNLRFLKPPGWTQTESGRWGVFKSPDREAVLAFVGFNRPGESTALIGKAARVLGVRRVVWKKTSHGTLGKGHFRARIGSGVCDFNGVGYISYATVDPGSRDQLLVIYTVSAAGSDKHKAAVRVSLDSLQRR